MRQQLLQEAVVVLLLEAGRENHALLEPSEGFDSSPWLEPGELGCDCDSNWAVDR